MLEHNYFEVPEAELGRQRVLLTMVGGDVLYIAENAGEGFGGVTAKFPNNATSSVQLGRKAIGGLDRKQISHKGRSSPTKLRQRHGCVHS